MNGKKISTITPGAVTRVLLLVIFFALGGCSLFNSNNLKSKDFTLLVASSDPQVRVAQQQWQVQQGADNYALEVVVERGPHYWRWIMLNNLGQRLATAEAVNGTVRVERLQSHPANHVLPALIQAWQLGYWPLNDLQAANPRWDFVDGNGGREARFSGILRASIEYQSTTANPWQGSLSYNTRELRLLIHSQPLN
ncbi:MAG TPA: DUF3261 domain-containing protein [Cellvibrio sp.]